MQKQKKNQLHFEFQDSSKEPFKDLILYEPIELMWPVRAQGPERYLGCPQVGQFSSKVIKERVNFWFSMKIAQWV